MSHHKEKQPPAAQGRKRQRKNHRNNAWINVLLVLCLGVFVFSAYKLISILTEYKAGSDEYAQLTQYAPQQTLPENFVSQLLEQEKNPDAVIEDGNKDGYALPLMDFTELKRINPDVKAWLTVFDTPINYPLVQTDDNSTYLTRTFEGKTNSSGCLFISQYNENPFADTNTVIYGHNMKNGSMFHTLVDYKDDAYFASHRFGLLYTPEKTYWLEIVSAYVTQADAGFDQVIFNEGETQAFFQVLTERTTQELGYNTDELIPLLTLSTCTYEFNNARYVVHARIHS